MNRLEAARYLRNSHIFFDNGVNHTAVIHVQKGFESDPWTPGVYMTRTNVPMLGHCSARQEDWARMTWQEILGKFRKHYPRRHSYQCSHVYESGAVCTGTQDHHHCRSCNEVSYGILCHDCKKKSDEARYEITRLLANYHNDFGGVEFKQDDDLFDYMTGNYDEPCGRGRGDREDFHADG